MRWYAAAWPACGFVVFSFGLGVFNVFSAFSAFRAFRAFRVFKVFRVGMIHGANMQVNSQNRDEEHHLPRVLYAHKQIYSLNPSSAFLCSRTSFKLWRGSGAFEPAASEC